MHRKSLPPGAKRRAATCRARALSRSARQGPRQASASGRRGGPNAASAFALSATLPDGVTTLRAARPAFSYLAPRARSRDAKSMSGARHSSPRARSRDAKSMSGARHSSRCNRSHGGRPARARRVPVLQCPTHVSATRLRRARSPRSVIDMMLGTRATRVTIRHTRDVRTVLDRHREEVCASSTVEFRQPTSVCVN